MQWHGTYFYRSDSIKNFCQIWIFLGRNLNE